MQRPEAISIDAMSGHIAVSDSSAYVCMYACMYLRVYVSIMYACIDAMSLWAYSGLRLRYVCMYVCMYDCMHACMHVSVYDVCMH